MEAAKASVKKVLSKAGQHDTTVHESVAPSVEQETVTRTQHEKLTPAVEREVHQDHYHTTEQPIKHAEVLPETHHHKEAPVQTKTFEHGKDEAVKRDLANEQAQYRSTQTRVEGDRTKSTEPTVAGEHVHHHVHETIQPVVHKETVEPHVVHTTVPVHEIHHKDPQHHAAGALPPVSMDDFRKQGGSLGGREARSDFFTGEPKTFPGGSDASGRVGNNMGLDGHGAYATQTSNSSSGRNVDTSNSLNSSSTSAGAASKPGLLARVNPARDADGDGKSGFMS